jgi:putative effector of murein hydrolase
MPPTSRAPSSCIPARAGHGGAGGAAAGAPAGLKRLWLPLLGALAAGTLAATVTAIGIGWALGASKATLASLAPKSVTTPVAMGIAEKIGGLPSLTAVLVVSTGIVGAASARFLFDALRITDPAVRGFALGTAAHGIGTARAFQVSEEMGAFAGLAMGLSARCSARSPCRRCPF